MFHVREFHLVAQKSRKGKGASGLGSGTTTSLSYCVHFVENSGVLTAWNQKEKKELLIQNTIAREVDGNVLFW